MRGHNTMGLSEATVIEALTEYFRQRAQGSKLDFEIKSVRYQSSTGSVGPPFIVVCEEIEKPEED